MQVTCIASIHLKTWKEKGVLHRLRGSELYGTFPKLQSASLKSREQGYIQGWWTDKLCGCLFVLAPTAKQVGVNDGTTKTGIELNTSTSLTAS